jgi:hypothetical protein
MASTLLAMRMNCGQTRVILIGGLPADHTGPTLDLRDYKIQKPFSGDHLLGTIEQLVNGA